MKMAFLSVVVDTVVIGCCSQARELAASKQAAGRAKGLHAEIERRCAAVAADAVASREQHRHVQAKRVLQCFKFKRFFSIVAQTSLLVCVR
jgi:hypothetical protein